jgi:hypothetical protein
MDEHRLRRIAYSAIIFVILLSGQAEAQSFWKFFDSGTFTLVKKDSLLRYSVDTGNANFKGYLDRMIDSMATPAGGGSAGTWTLQGMTRAAASLKDSTGTLNIAASPHDSTVQISIANTGAFDTTKRVANANSGQNGTQTLHGLLRFDQDVTGGTLLFHRTDSQTGNGWLAFGGDSSNTALYGSGIQGFDSELRFYSGLQTSNYGTMNLRATLSKTGNFGIGLTADSMLHVKNGAEFDRGVRIKHAFGDTTGSSVATIATDGTVGKAALSTFRRTSSVISDYVSHSLWCDAINGNSSSDTSGNKHVFAANNIGVKFVPIGNLKGTGGYNTFSANLVILAPDSMQSFTTSFSTVGYPGLANLDDADILFIRFFPTGGRSTDKKLVLYRLPGNQVPKFWSYPSAGFYGEIIGDITIAANLFPTSLSANVRLLVTLTYSRDHI